MKYLFLIFVSLCTASATIAAAVTSKNTKTKAQTERPAHVAAPKLKADQYALFLEDKYIIFKTKKTDGLELDLSCYKKNNTADCMALTYAKMKAENVESPHPAMNNMAAFHCVKMNGRNLLALDHKHNEIDFCRFPDKSMVSSWSMYLRHHPVPVIK